MSRTDVHAPKNLRPEDYEFVGCGNFPTADLDAYSPINTEYGRKLLREGWRFDSEGAGCRHCGQFIIYYAVLKHIPSHKLIKVGETCLDNRFSLANAQFQHLRKAAKLNRERKRLSEKRSEFLANAPNSMAYEYAKNNPNEGGTNTGYDFESFNAKFVRYVERYGEASDKFVAAILRAKVRTEEWAAKKAEEALTASPVVEGRVMLTGEVLSAKWKFTAHGDTLKLVVKDDRGFKVYGTCPSAVLNSGVLGANDDVSLLKGRHISFVATVTTSGDDPTFGFFKRPSQGALR